MTLPNDAPLQKLQFYVTTAYPCGYLPKKLAQSLIATPQNLVDGPVYSGLIQQGFRRSGKFAYRPHCEHCHACVSVRLPVNAFQMTRSQQRALKKHADLQVTIREASYDAEHFALYQAYQQQRHHPDPAHATEQADDAAQYQQFLCQSNVESIMVEFRDGQGTLKMVSVIDIVMDGLSAVYTFYDASDKASYGTHSILWQINWAKQLELPYLYLGYWIADSQKMAYKQQFQPQEKLLDGEWVPAARP
ncbi:arginyltransferase [Methylophilus sp.]|jgi:leucyl-tRNA---protein transferase|uniref:arginyltransferase n=1 Tax=Methylophilus sp. TaxID=29541 RepID=UPI0011D7BEAA|nr:arginyltransferase [Methylophilus sp.]TXI45143.1 MAG: arginyltransferase [Methylophilus sp.]